MIKPGTLRAALVAALPEFQTDADRLRIYIDSGRVASRLTPGLGYEYRYRLRIFVEAFTGAADAIMVPLLLWLRVNQPDLFLKFGRDDEALIFEADILDQSSWDIAISFELTETVQLIARPDGSGWDITHLPEPQPGDVSLTEGITLLDQIFWLDERILPGPPLSAPDA